MLTLAFEIQQAKADEQTVYINADGSITPAGAPILTSNNITYTFTGNMSYPAYSGIVVERNNIAIDGDGYTVQGSQSGNGLSLTDVNNVTIENTNVIGFSFGIYLLDSNNNIICGNNVTANYEGIYLDSSSYNALSRNNATANGYDGIYLYSSSNNTLTWNEAMGNSNDGIFFASSSSSNTVSWNNVTTNSYDGIHIIVSSNNTFNGNNVAANGYDGIYVAFSSNTTIYHNNFIANVVQASTLSVGNAWDNGYPSGGNYWSDYNGTDLYSGPYQNITGSDGIGDTPYVIDANNIDHYPLMKPYAAVHDVGIVALNLSKTVVCRSYGLNVTLTAADLGDYPETFNVTAYANTTIISSQNVTLSGGTSTGFTFTGNTTVLSYGNYTLSAYARPVPGETNTANNNCTGGWFIVSIPGDITGNNGWPNGRVEMKDIAYIAAYFGTTSSSPNWKPNADINNDGRIDMKDIAIAAANYGQHST